MGTLDQLKEAANHPMLTPHKKRLEECIRQLEVIAGRQDAKAIPPAVWQLIFTVIQQIIQTFIRTAPVPSPSMLQTQATPVKERQA